MGMFDPIPEIEAEKARQREALGDYFDFGPGGMLGFPDDAYNKKGELKGGIGGMSPAKQALLTFALSAMAQPRWGNNARGGVGRAGLDALNVYNQRLAGVNQGRQQFLKNERQGKIDLQNKQLFDEKMKTALDKRNRLKQMETEFPNMIQTMKDTGVSSDKIAQIQAMAQTGNLEGAYQSAVNVISTASKEKFGMPEIYNDGSGNKFWIRKGDQGEIKTLGQVSSSDNKFVEGQGGEKGYYNVLMKNWETPDSNEAKLAFQALKKTKRLPVLKDPNDPLSPIIYKNVEANIPKIIEDHFGPYNKETPTSEEGQGDQSEEFVKSVRNFKPTEGQEKSYGFAKRMVDAMQGMDEMDSQGTPINMGMVYQYLTTEDGILREPVERRMSGDEIIYARNVQDFVSANLRRESGAVIGIEEMQQEFRKYFYVPGLFETVGLAERREDTEKIQKNFRKSRETLTNSMVQASDKLWKIRGNNPPVFKDPYKDKKPEKPEVELKDNQESVRSGEGITQLLARHGLSAKDANNKAFHQQLFLLPANKGKIEKVGKEFRLVNPGDVITIPKKVDRKAKENKSNQEKKVDSIWEN
tara:strand:+ start:2297 stop:4045 length:1749 start_codon:yes stop_codon:yes gene_type:complete